MKLKMIVMLLALGLFLIACGGGNGNGSNNTTVTGQLGTQGLSSIGSFDASRHHHSVTLNNSFNQLQQAQLGTQATTTFVRGINAAVMNEIHLAQLGGGTLFGFEDQQIVAVNSTGTILGKGTISDVGEFSLDVPNNTTVAILLAVEDDNGELVCTDPLEIESSSSSSTEPALFVFTDASGASTQGLSSIGTFNLNENSANPATAQVIPELVRFEDAPEFQNNDFLNCNNNNTNTANLKGDFDWLVPTDFPQTEDIIYDFSIALGLEITGTGENYNAEYVNAAAINSNGQFDMEIPKAIGQDVELSIIMFDVGLLDPAKYGVPLTAIYDLNAALGLQNTIISDNDCTFRYLDNRPPLTTLCNYGVLEGGMGIVAGTVLDINGNPVSNADVLIVLNSESILAYNTAITNSEGFYVMLVPATSDDLSYSFAAFDDADTPTIGGLVSRDFKVTGANFRNVINQDIVLNTPLTP